MATLTINNSACSAATITTTTTTEEITTTTTTTTTAPATTTTTTNPYIDCATGLTNYKSYSVGKSTATNSVTVNYPLGSEVNDVFLLMVVQKNTGATLSTPSGYTKHKYNNIYDYTVSIYSKDRTGSEPSDETITSNLMGDMFATIVRVSDYDYVSGTALNDIAPVSQFFANSGAVECQRNYLFVLIPGTSTYAINAGTPECYNTIVEYEDVISEWTFVFAEAIGDNYDANYNFQLPTTTATRWYYGRYYLHAI